MGDWNRPCREKARYIRLKMNVPFCIKNESEIHLNSKSRAEYTKFISFVLSSMKARW
jgi:hypothetical protein|tara:strand:- start:2970 stop:3140 length:171 start_codon:yes stop_codon:yes gene_type:complete